MHTRAVNLLSVVLLAVVGGCASLTTRSVTLTMQAEPADFETQLAEYVEVQEALAADNFEDAAAWDRAQHRRLSPQERQCAARVLKARAFPPDAPDVRACRER